jgi:hypothetical protein
MTLVSTIIRDAFRESNLIAIAADPTTAEQAEALRLLNRLILSVLGTEMGEQLSPIIIGRNNINRPQGFPWYEQVPDQVDWFVPANSRLFLNLTFPQTVYLDPNPEDGARFAYIDKSGNLNTYPLTINANGRTIDNSFTETDNTNNSVREYFFRADTGNWSVVTPLGLADEMPFPPEFDTLFIVDLAMRLNPRHAQEADTQSIAARNRAERNFKARYRQHREMGSELGLVLLPSIKDKYFDNSRYANAAFDSGYAWPYSTVRPYG